MSDKREELEAIATEAVQRSGLSSLSFRTLAEAGGVKSSSVHYYFPAKNDLARVLIEEYSARFQSELVRIAAGKDGLRQKLERFIGLFEEAMADGKFCLCGAMAAEVASLDDASRAVLKAYFRASEQWLEALLEAHTDEVETPIPRAQFARILMSGLEGAILIDRVDESRVRLAAMRELVRSATT